jgi:spore germination protein GerM
MTEPTGHCPYLGLKQNRAIRFASPTPEHRCYVSGEPLEIPVDQTSYCLSQGHVHCPLYMGLTIPTTSEAAPVIAGAAVAAPATGMRGWYATLSPRDRAIYTIMIGMLAIIVAIYLLVGLQTLFGRGGASIGGAPTAPAPTSAAVAEASAAPPTAAIPTSIPPTPTDLPTSVPTAQPTAEPTDAPLFIPPTSQPTLAPTVAPTTAATSSATAAQASPTMRSATATQPPATARPAATAAPAPTSTPRPTAQPQPTQPPAPTEAPPVAVNIQPVTLYFADVTGMLLVPVRRNASVEDNRVAEAAVRELIAGPRNGLGRLVAADTNLLGITIDGGTATVNFDRDPGDYDSILFTLTEFRSVQRVQFQINRQNVGGARGRPVLNPINPSGLAFDYGATEFLPLYFPSVDGIHDVRLIRMVPKTKQTAEATVRALLEGPAPYDGAVIEVIPAGVELRGIKKAGDIILVDFTEPFAGAPNAAIRTIVESLTPLPTVGGVQFLVEGNAYLDGQIFRRPAINQE